MDANSQNLAPAVYDLLLEEPNLAVEDALLQALPDMEPWRQEAAIDLLIRRGREQGLQGLVAGFGRYDAELQARVLARSDDLYAGCRLAVASESREVRLGAIELVLRSGDIKLAYLLAEALGQHCPKTRAAAGEALHGLAVAYLDRCEQAGAGGIDADQLAALQAEGDYLGRALLRAIDCWKLHFRVEVLTAAMWMADRLDAALLDRAEATRSSLGRAILERLRLLNDPRMAGFCLRALVSPTLRPDLVQRIATCTDLDFVQALAREAWLLADPRIARECARIRRFAWLENDPHRITTMPVEALPGLIRLIGASGISPQAKVQVYRHLLFDGPPEIGPQVLARLVKTSGPQADELLWALANRPDELLCRWARNELRRRGLWTKQTATDAGPQSAADVGQAPIGDPFDAYWQAFEQLDHDQRLEQGESLKDQCPDLLVRLRAKLALPIANDRTQALKLVVILEQARPLADQIYRLTSDYDAVTRGMAISLLAQLEGPTTRRIARRALEDPDPRVQSNAMELMDRLSIGGRQDQMAVKLQSTHHRVRATAIACLLKMEAAAAAETLLDMLVDPSGTQRISALWVVERLQLSSMLARLQDMARTDPETRVRRRAQRILDSMTGASGGLALAAATEERL